MPNYFDLTKLTNSYNKRARTYLNTHRTKSQFNSKRFVNLKKKYTSLRQISLKSIKGLRN